MTRSLGSVPAPKAMSSWVLCRGLGKTLDEMTVTIPHDLYVFGTQENSMCDREWVESIRAGLKDQTDLEYKPVSLGCSGSGEQSRAEPFEEINQVVIIWTNIVIVI